LAVLAMTQVKAVEITVYLKTHGAAKTRTEIISHQTTFHGLLGGIHITQPIQAAHR